MLCKGRRIVENTKECKVIGWERRGWMWMKGNWGKVSICFGDCHTTWWGIDARASLVSCLVLLQLFCCTVGSASSWSCTTWEDVWNLGASEWTHCNLFYRIKHCIQVHYVLWLWLRSFCPSRFLSIILTICVKWLNTSSDIWVISFKLCWKIGQLNNRWKILCDTYPVFVKWN